jgi:probable HAF family extracellular repeat protein
MSPRYLVITLAAVTCAVGAPVYRVVDLGSFSPADINTHGQIAGSVPRADGLGSVAAVWKSGDVTIIGALPGGRESSASAINDAGAVVGTSQSQYPTPWGGYWSRQHGFLYDGATVQALTGSSGDHSSALGVNGSGIVVGTVGGNSDQAMRWPSPNWTNWVHGQRSAATAINASGDIVGYHSIGSSPFTYTAFVWSDGVLIDIPPHSVSGYDSSIATAINDHGQVAGYYGGNGPYFRSFLWANGQRQDLGAIGTQDVVATDINNQGQIVGYSSTSNVAAGFIWWIDGGIHDINDMISTPGWHVSNLYRINDNGQIVGYGSLNGVGRGVLLEPVPEPTTLSLAALGVAAAMLRRLLLRRARK